MCFLVMSKGGNKIQKIVLMREDGHVIEVGENDTIIDFFYAFIFGYYTI